MVKIRIDSNTECLITNRYSENKQVIHISNKDIQLKLHVTIIREQHNSLSWLATYRQMNKDAFCYYEHYVRQKHVYWRSKQDLPIKWNKK